MPSVVRDPTAESAIHSSLLAMTDPNVQVEEKLSAVRIKATIDIPQSANEWKSMDFESLDRVGGRGFKRSVAYDGSTKTRSTVHGDAGTLKSSPSDDKHPWRDRSVVPDYAPYALLWEAYRSRTTSLKYLGPVTQGSSEFLKIVTETPDYASKGFLKRREWLIDSKTFLPSATAARSSGGLDPYVYFPLQITYSHYVPCGIHVCPQDQIHRINGHEVMRLHSISVEWFTDNPSESMFATEGAK